LVIVVAASVILMVGGLLLIIRDLRPTEKSSIMRIGNYFSGRMAEIQEGTYVPSYKQIKELPEFSGINQATFRIARKKWYRKNFQKSSFEFSSRLKSIKAKNLSENEYDKEVKVKNLWVGITLIVIGILIIVGGIVRYYIEEAYCPSAQYACVLHGWGGMGLFGVNFLGLTTIIVGIIFPYRKRRRTKRFWPLLILILPTMAYFLSFLIVYIFIFISM